MINQIDSYLKQAKSQQLQRLKEVVAQPSVSATNQGVEACAILLKKLLKEIGFNTQILPTKGHPVVFGEIKSKQTDSLTVLFYGHYDVQPPDPLSKWHSPPFEPTVRNNRLYGRGTGDNKGQFMAHVEAVKAYLDLFDDVPCNVKIILEGEEESGSPHLWDFVSQHQQLLDCDLVYTSDGPKHTSGNFSVFFGVRGILLLEISLITAAQDNHSGNMGGTIPNAAYQIAKIINSIADETGHIKIPRFYEDVIEPSVSDLALINAVDFAPLEQAKAFGVTEINLSQEQFFKKLTLEPVFNVNGIWGGYQQEGSKTIIPCQSGAKFDFRLVANQDPSKLLPIIEDYLYSLDPNLTITRHGFMYPSRTDSNNKLGRIVCAAIEEAAGQKPFVLPSCGGSLPDYVWTKLLQKPSVIVPYANADEANHSPNENIDLCCFYEGIKTSMLMLKHLGKINRSSQYD